MNKNTRLDPNGNEETHFRQEVRNILDLDWSTRNYKIYEELRRLKRLEAEIVGKLRGTGDA